MTAIEEHLQFLYGETLTARLEPELRELLRRHQASAPGAVQSPRQLALTEKDALLITYGDQVRREGEAPLRTLADFCAAHLRETVSGVHLLPFYPWSSDDGFSVKDFKAVDPALGTWEDIERFRPDFDLMFDGVFNHLSVRGEWFEGFVKGDPKFHDYFVTVEGDRDLSRVVRPRALPLLTEFATAGGPKRVWTTFSADQADLNFRNPNVLSAVLEVLLFYVAHGARYIRLDAIAYLWKEIGTTCIHLPQTHRVIQLMRAVLDEVAPDVMLITETNVPHPDNISYFGDGSNEAQLVYNFALPPLVFHSIATGNAEKLTQWAQTLALPSTGVTFFNFLASHDGIGLNPARGILTKEEIAALVSRVEAHGGLISYKFDVDGSKTPYELNVSYFDALSNPMGNEPLELQIKRFIAAHAVMFSLQGVPGIYFHSLFGSRNDRAAAVASGMPRRINRRKLDQAEVAAELSDNGSLRSQVFGGLKALLQQRRAHSAFAPTATQTILTLDPRVFAVRRENSTARDAMLCLHNLSGETVRLAASGDLRADCTLAPYEVKWQPIGA